MHASRRAENRHGFLQPIGYRSERRDHHAAEPDQSKAKVLRAGMQGPSAGHSAGDETFDVSISEATQAVSAFLQQNASQCRTLRRHVAYCLLFFV